MLDGCGGGVALGTFVVARVGGAVCDVGGELFVNGVGVDRSRLFGSVRGGWICRGTRFSGSGFGRGCRRCGLVM